ncbi:GNAT family N-acetyltransferase [Alteribacter populi]|uniref:GNAT family N-acetyltransferase n=1 Tax=Alteribacter populi TaxID=2011011 RepID=UPI000BBA7DA5|nr:GNAT family N-acetyltransferase [Alteribacter populi]
MKIRLLKENEHVPMDLLMLADPSEAQIDAYLSQSLLFVLEVEEAIVGAIVILQRGKMSYEIMNVAVKESEQGKGYGRKMITFGIGEVDRRGGETLLIATGNSSIQQLALYQKCGFRMTEIIPNYFIENYADLIFENGIQCCDRIELTYFIERKE